MTTASPHQLSLFPLLLLLLLCISSFHFPNGISAAKFPLYSYKFLPSHHILLRSSLVSREDANRGFLWPLVASGTLFSTSSASSGTTKVQITWTFDSELFSENAAAANNKQNPFHLDLVLFHAEEADKIGIAIEDASAATSPISQRAYCTSDGKLALKEPSSEKAAFYHDTIRLDRKHHEAYSKTFPISKSGVYYFLMINCDVKGKEVLPPMQIDGFIDFVNPWGYLDAENYGFLPLYLIVSIIYFLVACVWMLLMLFQFKNLIRLQIWISVVLFLQLLEAGFYYLLYAIQNDWDTTSPFILACSTLSTIYRKSTVRLLVLVLAMGYGLVRQHLGSVSFLLIILGLFHLIAGCVHELAQIAYSHLKLIDENTAALLQFPLALADTVFFVWTFFSIVKLVRHLRDRKQMQKVRLYQKFLAVLIIYGVGCSLWFMYTSYHLVQPLSYRDAHWATSFIDRGIWYLMELILFLSLMVLFRPSAVKKVRYSHQAYQTVKTQDDDLMDSSLNWVSSLVENNEPMNHEDSTSEASEVELHDMNENTKLKRMKHTSSADIDASMKGFVISDDEDEADML